MQNQGHRNPKNSRRRSVREDGLQARAVQNELGIARRTQLPHEAATKSRAECDRATDHDPARTTSQCSRWGGSRYRRRYSYVHVLSELMLLIAVIDISWYARLTFDRDS